MQRVWSAKSVEMLTQSERATLSLGTERYPASINEQPPEPWPTKPKMASECDAIVHKGKDGVEVGMGEPGFGCPFLSCMWHTAIGYSRNTGSYSIDAHYTEEDGDPVPDVHVDATAYSCARKAAAAGPLNLEAIGKSMSVTRERIRQIVESALVRVRQKTPKKHLHVLAEYADVNADELVAGQRVPERGDLWRWLEGDGGTVVINRCSSGIVEFTRRGGQRKRAHTKEFTGEFAFVENREPKRASRRGKAA